MNSNELEQLKEEYKRLIDKRNELNNLIALKKRLENSDVVKSYFEVLKKIEEYEDQSITKATNKVLIDKIIEKMKIKLSNGIYVYFGTYKDIAYREYLVNEFDSSAQYRLYVDIEKPYSFAGIEVPIEECEEFEKNHIILMPKNLGDRKRMYDEARVKFFETCIVEGQEKAIQKISNIKAMADEEKNEKRLLIRRETSEIGIRRDD